LTVDGQALTPDFLIATADSSGSRRPRLTIEPLGKALGLKIDSKYRNKNCRELADELEMQKHGHRILIAWHHGEIPALVEALGADPEKLLPGGKWPGEQFGWVLLLRYDSEGRLEQAQCIHEKLMPGDN
jgi:broad specificity phosphatase PhoE